jgi:hypothetical protein
MCSDIKKLKKKINRLEKKIAELEARPSIPIYIPYIVPSPVPTYVPDPWQPWKPYVTWTSTDTISSSGSSLTL